ncbi:MAG: HEPN domain-containing protein [Bacteroidales bacterium]|nr:HEPN domain-containing protein [Bacteroidales bacterium]
MGALLQKKYIQTESHKGVRLKFGQHFVKAGIIDKNLARHFKDLFEMRNKGDYNDFYDFDEETVKKMFPPTKAFIERIEELIRK